MDIKLQIFEKGKTVTYNGRYYTVDHTILVGYDLYLRLEGVDERVRADKVFCDPTIFKIHTTHI